MMTETGRVVAIEADSLWVETIQQSTCSRCAAEKGCGQSLLAKWGGHTAYLRVLLQGRNPAHFQIDDQVQVGIPEDVVVKGSLLVYLVPLLAMILGAGSGHAWAGTETASLLGGVLGFALGGYLVRWQAHTSRNDERLHPVLIDDEHPVRITFQ